MGIEDAIRDFSPTVIKNITIDNYGAAKRNFEDLMTQVNDIVINYTTDESDGEDTQKKIDELQGVANEQKSEIDKFEKDIKIFDSKYLGENIKILAKKKGLKIPDVEGLIGVSPGYISRTVNPDSKKRLSIDVVWQLSKIFSINMSDLLDRDLTEAPKTVKPVENFLIKLRKDTDDSDIHWKNAGKTCNNINHWFFKDYENEDGSSKSVFSSVDESLFLTNLKSCIYTAEIKGQNVFIFKTEDALTDIEQYEIYVEVMEQIDYEDWRQDITTICVTSSDPSGILYARAEELMNSIMLHEKDFVVSNEAKSFIDRYMGVDEELPFN